MPKIFISNPNLSTIKKLRFNKSWRLEKNSLNLIYLRNSCLLMLKKLILIILLSAVIRLKILEIFKDLNILFLMNYLITNLFRWSQIFILES